MNIWVDITNAPHVIFFKAFIKQWQKQGHNVVVTARDLSGSLALLEANGIDYIEIGSHYGANKLQKVKGLLIRCKQLRKYLVDKSIDVAVSQSSFYSPLVAKMLGIRCVYTNDNEFAKGNLLANVFANKVLYPESLKPILEKSYFSKKFCYYPGTKEGIYLCDFPLPTKINNEFYKICIRPEPWTAQYHKRDDRVLIDLLTALSNNAFITILPRDNNQCDFFESLNLNNVTVQNTPLSLSQIYQQFDFFIGAGGSMSRELAFLGLPCLSMYQGELLSVDKSLIQAGTMIHEKYPNAELINNLLANNSFISDDTIINLRKNGGAARVLLGQLVLGIPTQKKAVINLSS